MTRAVRLLVGGALAAVVLVAASPAQAEPVGRVKEFGWWTKRPGAQPTPNGFEVANGPDGAESVAAFRVTLSGSVAQATLKFTEATDPNVAAVSGTPTMKICGTTSTWTADQQGTFDKAPTADCTSSVKMTADKTTWSADVTPLLTGKSGDVALMAVPDVQPTAGLVQPTFNRQFGAPLLSADGTVEASSTAGASGGSGSSGASYTGATAARPEVAVGNSFSTPKAAPAPTSATGTATGAASTLTPTPTTQPSTVTPPGVTIGAAHAAGKEWGRLVLYLPLAVLLGLGWVLARKSLAARDLIAS